MDLKFTEVIFFFGRKFAKCCCYLSLRRESRLASLEQTDPSQQQPFLDLIDGDDAFEVLKRTTTHHHGPVTPVGALVPPVAHQGLQALH